MNNTENKNAIYAKACEAFSRKDYSAAIELFTELDGWLDSKEKILACEERVANPRFDEERQNNYQKIKQYSDKKDKPNFKVNKKILIYSGIAFSVCLTIILIIIAVNSIPQKQSNLPAVVTQQSALDNTSTVTISESDISQPYQATPNSSSNEEAALPDESSNAEDTQANARISYLTDDAHLLSENEKASLEIELNYLSNQCQMDIVVVTVYSVGSKSVQEYADDFYDYNDFGYNESNDGLLLLIVMESRDWYISTCGNAIPIFSDEKFDILADAFVSYLSNGQYYRGFEVFAEKTAEIINNGV